MGILGHPRAVLETNQDRIDPLLSEPLHCALDRGLERLDWNLRQGIIRADLPQNKVGLIKGDVALEAFRLGRG